jgi:hypothetical protein
MPLPPNMAKDLEHTPEHDAALHKAEDKAIVKVRGGGGEHSLVARFPLSPHCCRFALEGSYDGSPSPYVTPMIPVSCGGLGEKESERAAW